MSNKLLSRHKRGAMLAAAFCTALALAACGSDNDTPQNPPGGGSTPPPPVATGDAFFAYVSALVANLFDNTEPVDIDAVAETKPENTEPEPVS